MPAESDPEDTLPNASFTGRGDVAGVFDAWAREGHMERMAQGHLATAGGVLDAIEPPPQGRFLDVGCGAGAAGDRVHARRPDVQVVAFDVGRDVLERARRREGIRHLLRADATRIPLRNGVADAAFSMEVLYYLPDPTLALREVRRVLRAGGTFDLMVDFYEENPHSADWPELMGLDMTRWSGPRWADALAEAGFADVTHRRVLPDPEAVRHKAYEDAEYADWAANHGSLRVAGRVP